MSVFIALLRGVNVSGKNLIKMADLKKVLLDIGFSSVKTYKQSGNIIFKPTIKSSSKQLEEQISDAILMAFKLSVPVLVIAKNEFAELVSQHPGILKDNSSPDKLYYTLLFSPAKESTIPISTDQFLPDLFFLNKKMVYIYCNRKYSDTKLTNTYFEKTLNVTATTRNYNTCMALIQEANMLA